jgi:ATP-dependent Clp protease ATP-binding subunit ClpA
MKTAVMDVVGQHFRPEFINRVDEMVVFHPLDRDQIRMIAGIQLGNLRKRLESHGFGLDFSDAALDTVGEAGFDPVYGARPLKRAIQNEIENPLAQKILAGDYATGETRRARPSALMWKTGVLFSRKRSLAACANLAVTAHNPLIAGEFRQGHRAAGV